MTTRTTESLFKECRPLSEFIRNGPIKGFRGFRRLSPCTVTLQYEMGPESTQEDVGFRALDFIKATSSFPVYTDVEVKIIASDSTQETAAGKVELSSLRQKIFLFLIDLLQAHPDLTHLPALYIWIERTGTPREASLHAASSSLAIYLNKRLDSGPTSVKEGLGICYD
jgi:hypothetical protein